MTNKQYHQDTSHVSKSKLDVIHQSPYKYWDKYLNPANPRDDAPTEAQLRGSAMHCLLFEPNKFSQLYIVPTEKFDRRTSVGKMAWQTLQAEAEETSKEILTIEIYDEVSFMRDAAFKHPIVKTLLEAPGRNEYIYTWVDPETGVKCKAKADKITSDRYAIDAKSCKNITPEGFAKACSDYRYHVQNAFYSDGFFHAHNESLEAFIFIAISNEPPFMVKPYVLSAESVRLGRDAYMVDLNTYKKCLDTGTWPAFPGDNGKISEIELPKYTFQKPL